MDTYEKKYKNALTIAQSRFKIEKDESVLTCLGMMFPELRESEDDGIYREIYSIVHHHYERRADLLVSPRDRNEMLEKWEKAKSFLEKQKESHIPWYDYQKSKEAGYTIVPNEEYEQLIKQKEQNPAWSEEDEKMRNLAIEWAETMYGQFRFVDMGSTDFRKIVDWLRDLRPSWKPSEEQMDALEKAIVRSCSHPYGVPLSELYEQLKKL